MIKNGATRHIRILRHNTTLHGLLDSRVERGNAYNSRGCQAAVELDISTNKETPMALDDLTVSLGCFLGERRPTMIKATGIHQSPL